MQASRPDTHLAASDLACRRGDRVLFRGVTFDLAPGEALHVIGANGVGKSSLIRLLAGLLRPYAGAVARDGTVALLDERLALDPHQPLGAALAFWARLDGGTAPPLEALGLADLLDVPVRYLSTGQRKRAALVRVIGQDADIWLLDEPLNGLDRSAVGRVEALVAEHCASGGLCVIASHQPFAIAGGRTLDLEALAA